MIDALRFGDVFVHPSWWWTPALAVGLYGLHRFVDQARARRIADVLGPRAGQLAGELDSTARRRKRRWFAMALAFLLLALVEPTWGERPLQLDRSGADLVVCLDVSRSMLARDIPGAGVELSRLDAAKREIEALARRTRGDRLGLVVFAGEARLVAPLTRDTETWIRLSADLDPSAVRRGGTDLAAAIDTALLAIERGSDAGVRAAILLLTDGEDFGDASERAVAAARRRGVPLFGVGLGSELGSKVVVDVAGRAEFLKDKDGEDVVSRLDMKGLEAMTSATGGGAVRAGAEPGALGRLYEEEVSRVARGQAANGEGWDRESRYQWPLTIAFLLWIFELAHSERREVRRRRRLSTGRVIPRRGEADAPRALSKGVARASVLALVAGSVVALTGCGERGPGAIRAYQEGRFDEALVGFREAVARAGEDASAPLFDHHALAAIANGKWREAEVALEMARVRGGRSMDPRWAFLMGNVEYGRCEQSAAQAMSVESEPFAFDLAIVHAERALGHWKAAAVSRSDWPEARRNIERALRKLGELHAARAEAEARREKKKEKAPREQPEMEPETEEVTRKAQRLDADPELVSRILERLSARDREKREVRTETRRERSAKVERDW